VSIRPHGHLALQRFVDEGRTIPPADLVAGPDTASPNRPAFRSSPLAGEVRVSGAPEMRLRMSIDNKPDANLTAYLVDCGPPGATAEPFVVTRGWMDPQNRQRPDRSQPVTQGRLATYRWVLQPKDYVFAAGHRIGLVVFSSDQEYTLLPLAGPASRSTRGPAGSPSRWSAAPTPSPERGGRRTLGRSRVPSRRRLLPVGWVAGLAKQRAAVMAMRRSVKPVTTGCPSASSRSGHGSAHASWARSAARSRSLRAT
jgi:hypothetical protein